MKFSSSSLGSLLITAIIAVGIAYAAASVPSSYAETDVLPETPVVEATSPDVAGLEIVLVGIRNEKGKIIVAVFNKARPFESYDYQRAIAYGEAKADEAVRGAIKITMPTLTSGPYAISLFHDENGDEEFNYDGDFPLEGYGASGAENAYHEPTFEEAKVEPGRVFVEMFYLSRE